MSWLWINRKTLISHRTVEHTWVESKAPRSVGSRPQVQSDRTVSVCLVCTVTVCIVVSCRNSLQSDTCNTRLNYEAGRSRCNCSVTWERTRERTSGSISCSSQRPCAGIALETNISTWLGVNVHHSTGRNVHSELSDSQWSTRKVVDFKVNHTTN